MSEENKAIPAKILNINKRLSPRMEALKTSIIYSAMYSTKNQLGEHFPKERRILEFFKLAEDEGVF